MIDRGYVVMLSLKIDNKATDIGLTKSLGGSVFETKGCFPLSGIFGAERYFLLYFDGHSPPFGLQTKENVAPHGKFYLVENGLQADAFFG